MAKKPQIAADTRPWRDPAARPFVRIRNITKKFDVAKYFTQVDYAQGLYIHLMNKRWFDQLPADLQKVLLEVIEEESAKARQLNRRQQEQQIAAARANGVEFLTLSAADKQVLIDNGAPVYREWRERIGAEYFDKVRNVLGD